MSILCCSSYLCHELVCSDSVVFPDHTHLVSKLDNFGSGSAFDLCFGMHYFVSFLVYNHFDEEEKAGCLVLIFFLVSSECQCSVVPPHGAMDWSVGVDCGIS